ncbi:MAG: glutathione S-transferase family protein [Sandaracinaceae bacterium]
MADVTVHHLGRSRSHRILWLLEELGVDYELRGYDRDPETLRAPASLRQVHPLGRAPVVEVDGVVLAESGAVIEELLDRFGPAGLRPEAGTDAHRRFRFFLHYAEGSLMPPLLVALILRRIETAPLPFFIKPVARGIAQRVKGAYAEPEARNHLSFLEAELADRPWFTGDAFSAADIQMTYPLEGAEHRGPLVEGDYPRLRAFLAKARDRPAYRRAIERGGPVNLG